MAKARDRLWLVLLGVFAVGSAVFLLLPPTAQFVLNTALGLLSVAAIGHGVSRSRSSVRWPWYALAAGILLFVLGDVWFWLLTLRGQDAFPSGADVFYVAAYPALVGSMVGLVRARRPGKDRPGLLDALVISTGAAMLTWVFLLQPMLREVRQPDIAGVVYLTYPVADLLVLAVLVRLSTGHGDRPVAFRLVAGGIVALLVADICYMAGELYFGYAAGGPVDLAFLACYGLLGAAAQHPSMAALTRPAPQVASEGMISRARWRRWP